MSDSATPAEVRSGPAVREELASSGLESPEDTSFSFIDAAYVGWDPPPERIWVAYRITCPKCGTVVERDGVFLWGHMRDETPCPNCTTSLAVHSATFGLKGGKAVHFPGMYVWSRPFVGESAPDRRADLEILEVSQGPAGRAILD